MKIMCKYLLISLITIFLVGCNHQKNQKPLNQEGDYITIPINPKEALKTVNMSEIFSDIEYIPLESVDKHLIGNVRQVVVYKDRIYVFDQYKTQSVFCFQQDGKFLFELNRKGQGPNEYHYLQGISIDYDNDHLLLYCSQKIIVCDLEGNLIESHQNKDSWSPKFSYIGDGYAAFYGGYITNNDDYAKNELIPNLLITNTDDYKVENTDLFFQTIGMVTQNFNSFSSYQNGTVTLYAEYNDTIYHLSKKAVERAYYVDFGDMKKDKGFYSVWGKGDYEQMYKYKQEHDICNISAITESKTDIYFMYAHKEVSHYVFYNKNTKRVIDVCQKSGSYYDYLPFNNDISGTPISSYVHSTDGESFYVTIESHEIIKFKKSIQNSNAVNKDKLLKMLDGINEFDNPVIVKMKLKK
jgi:hypothetical protein